MASINISIKKEAYDFLSNLKTKEKSFSDVILEFKQDKNKVMNYFGCLKHLDWKVREKEMKKFRDEIEERLI